MAFTVTLYRPNQPGNIFRYWQVVALDADTTTNVAYPTGILHGFQSTPQFCALYSVDGGAHVYIGQWRVTLGQTVFRITKTADVGSGGTVRLAIAFTPGAFGV